MIIESAEQIRNLTGSYYANNDFTKIEHIVKGVEQELCTTLSMDTLDGLEGEAKLAAQQAVAYMATMRFYRLNDISHENAGRKVKIDKENEARPFEWQLARDDRAHLEEYYRALDRLVDSLQSDTAFQQTRLYKRMNSLIVKDADSLSYLTGLDPSPWLYLRLLPYLDESQRFVAKAYGTGFRDGIAEAGDELQRRTDGRRPRCHCPDGTPHITPDATLRTDEDLRERRWRQSPGTGRPRPSRQSSEAPVEGATLLVGGDEAATRRSSRY